MSSTASNPEIDRLAAGQYVSLVTYRKDGNAVPTPVWVSRDGDKLLVWTQADGTDQLLTQGSFEAFLAHPGVLQLRPRTASAPDSSSLSSSEEDSSSVSLERDSSPKRSLSQVFPHLFGEPGQPPNRRHAAGKSREAN